MANTSYTQQALAANASFQTRVRNALSTVAWQVLNEPENTPNNKSRVNYARTVINNLPMVAVQICPWLVDRPNLFGFETTFDFPSGNVVTASGDADIESQLHTDWDIFGRHSTGAGMNPPQIDITLEELYTVIGELEVVRRKVNMQIQGYLKQIDEMSAEITRLREENGQLAQTDNNQ